ncbi:MAG: L-lactate permease [Hyphomicrobiales bacterium]|nr:L-lactate permease [Hyphomicrobiales bacterium]
MVGAAFARTDPTALALHSSYIYLAFNILWLPIYWRMAERADIGAGWRERVSEAIWLVGSLGLAIIATAFLGPEPAMLAAFGPAIVLRYLIDERPNRAALIISARRILPFTLLIGWLALTRLSPPLNQFLQASWSINPFVGAPVWAPLFHAGTWLLVAAVLTAILRGHKRAFPVEIAAAWRTGRLAVFTVVVFAMMAELLTRSGIAGGLARGMYEIFGVWSVTVTPLISAVFGALANSGHAANGLFMPAQLSLATEAGLDIAAVVALQHAAALSFNMVSPVRMSIVCHLAGTPGHERDAYRAMMPFVLVIMEMGGAIDVEDGAGGVAGARTAEKHGGRGDLLRLGHALQRIKRDIVTFAFGHRRLDRPRCDTVDEHVAGRGLPRQPAYEGVDAAFGESVMRAGAQAAHPAGHRPAQHDATLACFHHPRQEGAREIDRAFDVGADDTIQRVLPILRHPVVVRRDGGRIDQAVDRADLPSNRIDLFAAPRIDTVDLRAIGQFVANALAYPSLIDDIEKNELRALTCTELCRGAPDAAGGTSDDDATSGQIEG